MRFTIATLAVLAAIPTTLAQTFTDCNPLHKTCDPDTGLQSSSFSSDFTKGKQDGWSLAQGTTINYGSKGAEFTIASQGQAPTIETDFYMFFGTVEVKMQAAPGVGIVSSIVLESDDLDEIDWEFLGGDAYHAQSNYFGKGNTTSYDRMVMLPVSSPQTTFHTYTLNWSPSQLVYSIDGVQQRVLNAADANGGNNYPQTPMKVKLGSWAGGAPDSPKGTVEWAGGYTDYSKGPFTMYVESVKITNMYPAKEYIWSDKSGSWQSIKVVAGSGVSKAAGNTNDDSNGSSAAPSPSPANPKNSVKPVQKAAATDSTTTTTSSAPATKTSALSTATDKADHKNGTSTLTTSARKGDATPAVHAGNATTTGSGSRSGSATSGLPSPARQTGAASTNSAAMAGLVAVFTLCMCMVML